MRPLFVTTLLAIGLVGCQDTVPPPGVEFTVDEAQYAPGDTAQLQLVNGVDQMLGYNLCFSELERQEGASWAVVPDTMTACTAEQQGLAPGDTARFTKTIMPGVGPGTYRYRTGIEFRDDERHEDFTTDAFRIAE